ncbi:hypothetical protein [Paenibacillus sp. J22TS3]|uniref:hypothetical protein n=1 Tax=Paenibacillus sp. J22TS3 TaxID=2807192 RepID=UPI001B29A97E|nr:hypothetical protein [Paenibacillus sp. J22TS3]GIP24438.1 hypothetical protein J22TS3_47130 [Paenibacillus sp. J22TS3]
MSKTQIARLQIELRLVRQPLAWMITLLYLLLLFTMVTGSPDAPRPVYYYNEMAMFVFAVMTTVLLFHNEIGGNGMEVIASYPISLARLTMRKWLLCLVALGLAEVGWTTVYGLKYGTVTTLMYTWKDTSSLVGTHAAALFIQALPSYMLISALTIAGIIVTRTLYGGMAAGFGYWMLDSISSGDLLKDYTLYTAYLPEQASFSWNRTVYVTASLILLAGSAWLASRRHRWISREEE